MGSIEQFHTSQTRKKESRLNKRTLEISYASLNWNQVITQLQTQFQEENFTFPGAELVKEYLERAQQELTRSWSLSTELSDAVFAQHEATVAWKIAERFPELNLFALRDFLIAKAVLRSNHVDLDELAELLNKRFPQVTITRSILNSLTEELRLPSIFLDNSSDENIIAQYRPGIVAAEITQQFIQEVLLFPEEEVLADIDHIHNLQHFLLDRIDDTDPYDTSDTDGQKMRAALYFSLLVSHLTHLPSQSPANRFDLPQAITEMRSGQPSLHYERYFLQRIQQTSAHLHHKEDVVQRKKEMKLREEQRMKAEETAAKETDKQRKILEEKIITLSSGRDEIQLFIQLLKQKINRLIALKDTQRAFVTTLDLLDFEVLLDDKIKDIKTLEKELEAFKLNQKPSRLIGTPRTNDQLRSAAG